MTATASGIQSGETIVAVRDLETFNLRLGSPSIFENAETVTLTLTRTDTSGDAVVDLSASRIDKLSVSPTTITIPAGQSQATVTLVGVDNQILDGTQTVTITAKSEQLVDATITLDVLDYEPLLLEIDDDSISENGGATMARLTRTDINQPLTATLTSTPGGVLSLPTTITFADGETTSQPFALWAIDNDLVDGVRVANVVATGPGYIDGADAVTVTDFEELELVTVSTTIPENAGSVQMRLRRTDPNGSTVASLSSTSPGRLRIPTTVAFNDGSLLSQPFSALLTDNDLLEGDQTVSIVATVFGYELSITEIVVSDHEQLVVTRVGDPLTESSATATFSVTRPASAGDAFVLLSGGAFDSLRLPPSVRFDPGSTSLTFTAEVVDNSIAAGDQQVLVIASSQGYVSGTLTETIEDNDTPELSLVLATNDLIEGARPTTARLTRNTRHPISVIVSPSVIGEISHPSILTFAAGRAFVEFEIRVPDNQLADGKRLVDLGFSAPGHPTAQTTLTIIDDEQASFRFIDDSIELVEGGAPKVASVVLGIRPVNEVRISVAASDQTQLTVSPAELTFTPDNWSIPQSVTVGTVDDLTTEGPQQLSLVASVSSAGAFDALPDQTFDVNLFDDDVPTVLVEQTDGSTIVNEFGLDDQLSLRLGTRPLTPVQVSIDGSTVPEAVFTSSVLTFTPDNWDEFQVVVVSTPLDFDADRNLIGAVYINVDVDESDPIYANADRRIVGVVHIDSILSDLRIRQQDDRVILVDEISGRTLRSVASDAPGGALMEMGTRNEVVFVEPMSAATYVTIETDGGNDSILLSEMSGGKVEGGTGDDGIALLATGKLPPETEGGFVLRNIERIDLTNENEQQLLLGAAEVAAMTDADNVLQVKAGPEDQVTFSSGWGIGEPTLVRGFATHQLFKDDAIIQLTNGSIWQNPLDRFDVDRNGSIGPLDALVTINRLATQDENELPPLPSSANENFYDVNGDGLATVRDALAVINAIASGGSPAAGESPAVASARRDAVVLSPAELASDTLVSTLARPGSEDDPIASDWNAAVVDNAIDAIAPLNWIDGEEEDETDETQTELGLMF